MVSARMSDFSERDETAGTASRRSEASIRTGRMKSSEMMVKRKMQPKVAMILEIREIVDAGCSRIFDLVAECWTEEIVHVVGPGEVVRVCNVANGTRKLTGKVLS